MTKLPLALVLALLAPFAQAQDATYAVGKTCVAEASDYPKGTPPYLNIRVEDKGNPQKGTGMFNSFMMADGLLLPHQGFNICDAYGRAVVATVEIQGDYERIQMECGGALKEVHGKSTIVLQLSTRKILYATMKLTSGVLIKSDLESFTCTGDDYARAGEALKGAKVVQGVLSKGKFITKGPGGTD